MDVDLKLYEEFSLKSISHTSFNCGYSEDGRLYILAQFGVYIFTLSGNLDTVFTECSFKKEFIIPSEFTPSEHLGYDLESFIYDLPRDKFLETVMPLNISSPNIIETTTTATPKVLSALWSPRGISGKTESLLAINTILNSLEIYGKCVQPSGKSDYVCVANISRDITQHFKSLWEPICITEPCDKYQIFKHRHGMVTPSAYTWSHIFSITSDNYILVMVGHLDGSITAWKLHESIPQEISESHATFVGRYKTELKQISCLYWHKTSETGAALIVADFRGTISVIRISNINEDLIQFGDDTLLWDECDYIKVTQIYVTKHNKDTYILAVKGCTLIIISIDAEGVVYDKKIYTPGSGAYPITALQKIKQNTWCILNMNCLFTRLEISSDNNEIQTKSTNISLKINNKKFGTFGFDFSANQVLFIFVTSPVKHRFSIKGKKFQHVQFFRNMSVDPFKILMENKSGSLRDYWDCIDILRVASIKEKRFPWIGIDENLNYDELSLLQLKTLRIIAKLSENIVSVVPVIREYHIKPYVLLHYIVDMKLAVQRIKHLLSQRVNGVELTKFQMRSIDLLNFFLKEMVMQDVLAKAQLGETFLDEIIEVMAVANELKYPPMPQCFWCGEKIIGSSCIPPHVDSRCAISLMPIMFIPGYVCPFCKCTVHKEIENETGIIMCPYCDVPMENTYKCREIEDYIKTNKNNKLVDTAFSTSPPEEVTSCCSDDCLIENMSPEDVPDNTTEYFTISDSEDETNRNEIVHLYWKTHSCELKIERSKQTETVT